LMGKHGKGYTPIAVRKQSMEGTGDHGRYGLTREQE
jgi:hypothetical protein